MKYQIHLFDLHQQPAVKDDKSETELKLLNWNIANSSKQKAIKQVDYILKSQANVIVLSEAKYSDGCRYIIEVLLNLGFEVFYERSEKNYSVIVAYKGFEGFKYQHNIDFLPPRLCYFAVKTKLGLINIMGMYVPSRGPVERKNQDKKKFQTKVTNFITSLNKRKKLHNCIVVGDLNIIAPDHDPLYEIFQDWEFDFYNGFINEKMLDAFKIINPDQQDYSWFGLAGTGYRFDHIFISNKLKEYINDCFYDHEVRENKLSDHSAMFLILKY